MEKLNFIDIGIMCAVGEGTDHCYLQKTIPTQSRNSQLMLNLACRGWKVMECHSAINLISNYFDQSPRTVILPCNDHECYKVWNNVCMESYCGEVQYNFKMGQIQ